MSAIEHLSGLEQGLILGGVIFVLFLISQVVQRSRKKNRRR